MPFWNRKKAQATEPPVLRVSQTIPRRTVRAGFDAAETTDDNAAHWSLADGLSADAAANPQIRRTLVRRSRYEIKNNCYARGLISTIVNDCIGTGPSLQVTTEDDGVNNLLEQAIEDWSNEVDLGGILRTLCSSEIESGEVLLVAQFNPGLKSPVKLQPKVVECDRLTAPYVDFKQDSDRTCDGIDYDDYENPTTYNLLKYHPGNNTAFTANPTDFTPVPAKFVFHLFKKLRPEQRRGIPELTPALPLFSQMRRLTLATLTAAESIADVALAITSDVSVGAYGDTTTGGQGGGMGFTPGEQTELPRGTATFLPPGTKLEQPHPEQPTAIYASFIDAIIREIARCVDVPFGIAAMDDSKANMSSAYLTRQGYSHSQGIRRRRIVAVVEWLIGLWIDYASSLPQFDGLRDIDFAHNHNWLWPSLGHHADPAKTANAQQIKLKNGLTDLPTEYAMSGREVSKGLANQAKALGITVPQLQAMLINQIYPPPMGMPNAAQPKVDPTGSDPAPEKEDEDVAQSTD